jgi:hypothetical protein
MTLKEYLALENLTFDDILDREDESAYWNSCIQFVGSKLNQDMDRFTMKQAAWISQIVSHIHEKQETLK